MSWRYSDGQGGAWIEPVILECSFGKNISATGDAGILSVNHSNIRMINCTIAGNPSGTNAFRVGSGLGSKIKIFNSVFWVNKNPSPANCFGGKDIYAATSGAPGPNHLARYNNSSETRGDYGAICDIDHSNVQSVGN